MQFTSLLFNYWKQVLSCFTRKDSLSSQVNFILCHFFIMMMIRHFCSTDKQVFKNYFILKLFALFNLHLFFRRFFAFSFHHQSVDASKHLIVIIVLCEYWKYLILSDNIRDLILRILFTFTFLTPKLSHWVVFTFKV